VAKRIAHGINGEVFKSECGDHVLLSVEDYNKIVRSLNLLTLLLSEREVIPSQYNIFKVLREQQSLPIIEDE